MIALSVLLALSLLLLTASIQPTNAQTCGLSVVGFSAQGEISHLSDSDTCDLELVLQAGVQDSCTATTYYSVTVQYTDINGIQQIVPNLNTITYTGPPGSIVTNYFPIPLASIQNGEPIVATFTESGDAGAASLAVTWTQEPLVVTSNTIATTTVQTTTDVLTTSTSTITSSSTVTVVPQTSVVTTTVGTITVTAQQSTQTITSTIVPCPKTKHELDIVYQTTQLSCNPHIKHHGRRSLNLKERQQPGVCYEFPDFVDPQTTTTITTSTSIDYTTVTTTDTITETTLTTLVTTTTAGTPTSFVDAIATVTSTPVTTRTVYTKAKRVTTTTIQTITIEVPIFPKSPPCFPPPHVAAPKPGGHWIALSHQG